MTLLISINIYKSLRTLEYQLETIKTHVKAPYKVVLNCNKYMYDVLLSEKTLEENIHINPEIIEKERFHGSLTQGIVSNMKYALENIDFKYFVVLSGRTIFYRDITLENFDEYFSKKKWTSIEEMEKTRGGEFPFTDWIWPILKKTKLAQHYMERRYTLVGEVHEGVCFSNNVTKNIVAFLDNNDDVRTDLYDFRGCVEEFSLHTIASNEYDKNNLEYGFVYIGNGSAERWDRNNTHLYTRKIQFLS